MRASRGLLIGAALLGILALAITLQRISRLGIAPVNVRLGQAVFMQNCAVCHGTAAESKSPAPPLNAGGHAHHHPDWELYMVITEGRVVVGEMPAWKGKLSDREIRSVIAYIKTLWTEDQRRFQEQVNQVRPTPP